MLKLFTFFIVFALIFAVNSCKQFAGNANLSVKREKVGNGELVLLTDSGMQSTNLEIYYTDEMGVNHWVSGGGDVHVEEDGTLASILRNKTSEKIIFRFRPNSDRVYDIRTGKLLEGVHDDAADNIMIFDTEKLKSIGEDISEEKSEKYRQVLDREKIRNTK